MVWSQCVLVSSATSWKACRRTTVLSSHLMSSSRWSLILFVFSESPCVTNKIELVRCGHHVTWSMTWIGWSLQCRELKDVQRDDTFRPAIHVFQPEHHCCQCGSYPCDNKVNDTLGKEVVRKHFDMQSTFAECIKVGWGYNVPRWSWLLTVNAWTKRPLVCFLLSKRLIWKLKWTIWRNAT